MHNVHFFISLSAPDLSKDKHKELSDQLREVCLASVGSPVIYSLVETIKSFLDDLPDDSAPKTTSQGQEYIIIPAETIPSTETVYSVPSVRDHLALCGRRLSFAVGVPCPQIYHGETITDRKSVFQVGV